MRPQPSETPQSPSHRIKAVGTDGKRVVGGSTPSLTASAKHNGSTGSLTKETGRPATGQPLKRAKPAGTSPQPPPGQKSSKRTEGKERPSVKGAERPAQGPKQNTTKRPPSGKPLAPSTPDIRGPSAPVAQPAPPVVEPPKEVLPPVDPEIAALAKSQWRERLRAANLAILEKGRETTDKALDASLKKNTAFVRKLREVSEKTKEGMVSELATLRLDKYLTEAVTSIGEARLVKSSEALALVEICSALHGRFPDFVGALWEQFEPQLKPKSADEKDVARTKYVLRFLFECHLVGLVTSKEEVRGQKIRPLSCLYQLLEKEKDHLHHEAILTHMAKNLGEELFAIIPRKARAAGRHRLYPLQDHAMSEPIPKETSDQIKKLYKHYLGHLVDVLKAEHRSLKKQKLRYEEYKLTRGSLTDEMAQTQQEAMQSFERIKSAVETLSDALDVDMPALPEDTSEDLSQLDQSTISIIRPEDLQSGDHFESPVWEDLETAMFYEDITDLAHFVPGLKKVSEIETALNAEVQDVPDTTARIDEPSSLSPTAEEGESDPSTSQEVVALDMILPLMPEMLSRQAVDDVAKKLTSVFDGKRHLSRLVETFTHLRRERTDLLPYYSRLLATFAPFYPQLVEEVIKALLRDFKRMLYKPDLHFDHKLLVALFNLCDSRRKSDSYGEQNIRYLSHLVLFKLVRPAEVFYILKHLAIDHFSPPSFDLLVDFFQTCGRYLHFVLNSRTEKWSQMVDTIIRKAETKRAEGGAWGHVQYGINMIKLSLAPPQKTVRRIKERSMMEQFIRYQVYQRLSKRSLETVLRLLRKMDWTNDKEAVKVMYKVFRKPQKIQFAHIPLLASLLSGLSKYHEDFCLHIIDDTIENIVFDMEVNDKQHAQTRLAFVIYLSEMYNYRLIDAPTLFNVLFHFLTFGHDGPLPHPAKPSAIDPPNDYFRVVLMTEILRRCGSYFKTGQHRGTMDLFLANLQVYYHVKRGPVPESVENEWARVMEACRPKWTRAESLEEAIHHLVSLTTSLVKPTTTQNQQEEKEASVVEEEEEEDEEEEDMMDGEAQEESVGEEEEEEEAEEPIGHASQETDEEEEEEEAKVVIRQRQLGEAELEAKRLEELAFAEEFGSLLQESLDSRRNVPTKILDVTLRARTGEVTKEEPAYFETASQSSQQDPSQPLEFTVMMRKGKDRTVILPEATGVAQRLRQSQLNERTERQMVKKQVMKLVERGDGSEEPALPMHQQTALPSLASLDKFLRQQARAGKHRR